MMDQHPAIRHWSDLETRDPGNFFGTDEPMGLGAAFGAHFGLKRIGIHHMRLLPGRRTSLPHAESHEQEFVHVVSGTPDVWLDGQIYRLAAGDSVGFAPGTGLAHSFLNNTASEVCLIVVGDSDNDANRIVYPVNPERRAIRTDWWHDAPSRPLGAHDGLSDQRRAALGLGGRATPVPGPHDTIAHWNAIENPVPWQYDQHDEPMGYNAALGHHFRLTRLGIHHQRLLPGRRTSFPHAESAEDEFVFVIAGTPDVWLDGDVHRLRQGDGVGFPAGTGLCHSFINNTDGVVQLLVVGDTAMPVNRILYPLNPERQAMRKDWWADAPDRPHGPHDGLSDLRRTELGPRKD